MAGTIAVICYYCRELEDCHTYGFGGSYAACEACAAKNGLTMNCDHCGGRGGWEDDDEGQFVTCVSCSGKGKIPVKVTQAQGA